MFGCSPKCNAISPRDMVDALQTELDHYYYDVHSVRVVSAETFADNSVRATMSHAVGDVVKTRAWGFHYCEHDERVIIDYLPA